MYPPIKLLLTIGQTDILLLLRLLTISNIFDGLELAVGINIAVSAAHTGVGVSDLVLGDVQVAVAIVQVSEFILKQLIFVRDLKGQYSDFKVIINLWVLVLYTAQNSINVPKVVESTTNKFFWEKHKVPAFPAMYNYIMNLIF